MGKSGRKDKDTLHICNNLVTSLASVLIAVLPLTGKVGMILGCILTCVIAREGGVPWIRVILALPGDGN